MAERPLSWREEVRVCLNIVLSFNPLERRHSTSSIERPTPSEVQLQRRADTDSEDEEFNEFARALLLDFNGGVFRSSSPEPEELSEEPAEEPAAEPAEEPAAEPREQPPSPQEDEPAEDGEEDAAEEQNDPTWVFEECCICLESLEHREVRTLQCAHRFHHRCIIRWLRITTTCPVCRTTI